MIPLFDISHQTDGLVEEIKRAWSNILVSGHFVSGAQVEAFELAFAQAHRTKKAVAVSNGTVALELTMSAMGVGPGDEVIVPANSFIATAEGVSNVGGTPVFVDIDSATANIDVAAAESAIGPRTVGVVGVHLYGSPFDAVAMRQLCDRRGIFLIEDAAQAHLARAGDETVGGLGHAGTFSFYPGKNLGAPGEGGMITTNDEALAAKLVSLRSHGETERYVSRYVGTNARMSEISAAVLNLKLPRLETWNQQRRDIASVYTKLLHVVDRVDTTRQPDWATSVHHIFSVTLPDRDLARAEMAKRGVETGLHYPIPIHRQGAYEHLGYGDGSLPVTEDRARRLMSLPIYPGLDVADVEAIVDALGASLDKSA